jgi:uncharacterized protein (DUF2235 family)
MKILIRVSWLALVFQLVFLGGCKKKYPEGGNFSLLSKKARVSNSWKVYNVTIDGKDTTENFNAQHKKYNLVMNTDGSYALMYYSGNNIVTEAGKWTLVNEQKRISFVHMDGRYEWEILKLKNKELWVNDTQFYGVKTEIHFVPF